MTDDLDLLTLADVEAARELLTGVVRTTPLEPSRPMTESLGGPTWLKCENQQRAGSYKVRGAYTRIARLSDAERAHGVVAASAGNHAQGVALAAGLLGIPATVFMPEGAPLPKVTATKGYGATIEYAGNTVDDGLVAAREFANRTGAVLIHPFDHRDVIAGQGTVGLEIVEDLPDVAAVVVPIGGGGLASGVAVAVRALAPGARLIGVESELAADARQSLREGRIVRWDSALVSRTIADGTRTTALGERTFAHLSALLDEIVAVSETEIAAGVRLAAEESRLVVEPSGALSIAAMVFHPAELGLPEATDGPVVAVVSGGNVDPGQYRDLLESPIPRRG
jgi:threonine dehydratase